MPINGNHLLLSYRYIYTVSNESSNAISELLKLKHGKIRIFPKRHTHIMYRVLFLLFFNIC